MKNIILSLCGGTGSWERPYKENGFRTFNITKPKLDVTTYIISEGKLIFYSKDETEGGKLVAEHIIEMSEIYGILAAPPCTMFSLARTRAKTPRDLEEGMKCVRACMDIIWSIREKQKIKFWALENPVGILRQFLGVPKFTFQPYDFGEPYTKKTDLWGYFNEPKKKPIKGKFKSISMLTSSKQKERRAITPKGFAEAFYKANCKS